MAVKPEVFGFDYRLSQYTYVTGWYLLVANYFCKQTLVGLGILGTAPDFVI